jgi:TolB-like protein
MPLWSAEIKELERLFESFKGQLPDLEKELGRLIKADDENMILLYSRRCLEVIIIDLCQCELKRQRGTEPLKGIIDKLHKERKVPDYISTSMHGLNDLSTYGAHPKDFDPEQVKPALNNLDIIIKWYLKYKETGKDILTKPPAEIRQEIKSTEDVKEGITISRKRLAGILGGLTGIIASVLAVLYFSNIIGNGKQTNEIEKSIAVLPFINDSPVDSNKYFINGIMEEVLNNLQKIKEFRVLSPTSTDQYKESDRPAIPEIAKKLDVNYLVEGSGQKYGNKFVLRVQLLMAEKEKILWRKSYEQEIHTTTDIIRVQSEIAQLIADQLNAVITPEENQLIEKISTSDLTAYDFYQKGREELGKFPFHDLIVSSTTYPIFFDDPSNKKSIDKARLLYRTALRYDSTFAPAYAELAAIYWTENYFREYFSKNYLDSVLFLANKALSFDDRLSDAYYIRAMYFGETGNIEQAREDFDKTLQINPNHWQAYYGKGALYLEEYADADYTLAIDNFRKAASHYHGSALPYLLKRIAYALSISGFNDLALDYKLKAAELEIDSSEYFFSLYEINVNAGNPEKGFEFLKKAYNSDSTNIATLWRVAGYYSGIGESRESLKYYKKYLDRVKELGITMVNDIQRIGVVYSDLGLKDSAEYYFKKQIDNCNAAIRLGRPYGISFAYYDLALIYASRGDKIKALEVLNIFKQREGMCRWFATALQWEPAFRNFKNDPDFQNIFTEIEVKYQEEHERVKKWLEEQGML